MNTEKLNQHWSLILHLAWSDIRIRYARSVLGPFWIVLSTAASSLGLGVVWSILFDVEKEVFIPTVTCGLVIWNFILSCIIEAPECFMKNERILKNIYHPIWIYPSALMLKNCIIFLHNGIIIAGVLLIYPQNVNWRIFMFIPSLLLVMVALMQISTVIAILGTRYKDVSSAVVAFMTIAFFLTPVLFRPEQLGVKQVLMWFNPLTYLVTVIRDPLTGSISAGFVYLVLIGFIAILGGILYFLISRYQHRVSYWI